MGTAPPPTPDVYLLFGSKIKDITDCESKKGVPLMVVITPHRAQDLIEKAKKLKPEIASMDISVSDTFSSYNSLSHIIDK